HCPRRPRCLRPLRFPRRSPHPIQHRPRRPPRPRRPRRPPPPRPPPKPPRPRHPPPPRTPARSRPTARSRNPTRTRSPRPRPPTTTPTTTPTPTPTGQAQLSAAYPSTVNAYPVWQQGTTGQGVTVAVLDSGVAADPDLVQPTNRLLASVNFADQRLTSDPGGHGTHVAGIIAGNGTRSAGEYVGIAPQANIVDVRVLGRTGSGRISSVVRGIEWAIAHRSAYNIRIISLSFGAPAVVSYRTDPMSAAIEIAWRLGLVVVAASGNGGPGRDTVVSPGIDPYAITVGASDDQGTLSRRDDTLA